MDDNRTLRDLCQDVLSVQDACNLSAVVHAWSRSIIRLRQVLDNPGTEVVNNHPINLLYADKVAHLTGMQSFGQTKNNYSNAYDYVSKVAKGLRPKE